MPAIWIAHAIRAPENLQAQLAWSDNLNVRTETQQRACGVRYVLDPYVGLTPSIGIRDRIADRFGILSAQSIDPREGGGSNPDGSPRALQACLESQYL